MTILILMFLVNLLFTGATIVTEVRRVRNTTLKLYLRAMAAAVVLAIPGVLPAVFFKMSLEGEL